MILSIGPSTGMAENMSKPKSPLLEAACRTGDELSSWKMYKGMGSRYELVSHQEFRHALMALSDVLTELQKEATGADAEHFTQFMHTITAGN